MDTIRDFFSNYVSPFILLRITVIDVIEILLIAVLVYYVIKWVKNTKAWALLKGILVLFAIYVLAALLGFDAILWIFANGVGVSITAIIILFQPELRKALEQLGKKSIVSPFFDSREEGLISDKSVNELVRAAVELGKAKTGALIVLERTVNLDEYEATGIKVDAVITAELLINIFEHNTPLHDGAVIVRGDRVTAATCYLPLSDNTRISKELGTRHRAAVGISEATDSFTIVVSEQTGGVSIAENGELTRRVSKEQLRERLLLFQNSAADKDNKEGRRKKFLRNIRKGAGTR
ncbi:MAG: diadenylate cyclase CdaA [Lachnospiraceae bacterium]|nr:diadenylate cyclase CdaA [Lachnospiraceae bacterium]